MKRTIGILLLAVMVASGATAAKKQRPLMKRTDCPYTVTQGLQDRQIALWASHGLYYNAEQDRWLWQRARLWTTVEDLFTTSITAPYLVPMLENAGAVVLQPRAYVRPGYQSVYIRLTVGNARLAMHNAQTITLQQGTYRATYEVSASQGAGMWHYVCTVPQSTGDSIQVTDKKGVPVETMVIDETTIGPSGLPRYAEAARYWLPYIGVPDAAWVKDSTYTDYLNDIVCRGGGVNYLLDQGIKVDLSLALHTDAGAALNDSLIGTMAIYTHKEDKDYADYVLNQVVGDLQRAYTPLWPRRELRRANYGETRTPKVPAMILEALSHQNYADMRYALDPAFRQAVARAVYKGIGRYLADIHGTHFVPTPLAPKGLRTSFSGDSLVITWHAVTDTLEPEAVPEYYIVYLREDGRTWDSGTCVKTGRMALPIRGGVRYDVCVASGNTGGISLRSDIVSACLSATDTLPPLLVVDAFQEVRGPKMMAFDSLTGGIVPGARPIPDGYEMAYIGEQINYNRLDPWHSDDDCGFGMCGLDKQGLLLVGNTHDYAVRHGAVLQRLGRSYVSCTADALSEQDSVYEQVDIVLGKSGAEQVERLYDWVSRLGWAQDNKKVLISGANVGYPHYACTSGRVRMNGQTYTFRQEMNTDRLSAEDVSAVSKLTPNDTVIARYADTGLPAILQGTNYTVCGLPLETLDDFENIYQQLIIHL